MKYLLTADQGAGSEVRVVGIDRRLYIKVCCVDCCLAAFPDSTMDSYRQILVLPVVSKMWERVTPHQLHNFLSEHSLPFSVWLQ